MEEILRIKIHSKNWYPSKHHSYWKLGQDLRENVTEIPITNKIV